MRIANNVPALLTHINLRQNDRLMSQSMNRLSTGLRINSAREDAAGMAIANKLSFQLVGLERASDNSQHGVSVVQTAEGALNEVHAMLQRMRELAVQAATDTLTYQDRMAIQREINDLTDEISALAHRSEFNTIKLLNGEAARVAVSWTNDPRLTGALAGIDELLTRILSRPLFVSENVPAGTLRYKITAPAMPAVVNGLTDPDRRAVDPQLDWSAPIGSLPGVGSPDAPFVGGAMRINGIQVNVLPHHTMNEVWQMIVNTSEYSGVNPSRGSDVNDELIVTFTSNRFGSHESVVLSGNADLWNLFGIYLPPTLPGEAEGEGYAYVVTGSDTVTSALPIEDPVPPALYHPVLDVSAEVSGTMSINGWPIEIHDTMSPRQIFNAIYNAGNLNQQIHRDYGVDGWRVVLEGPYLEDGTTPNPAAGEWRIEAGRYRTNPVGERVWHPSNNDLVILADNPELLEAAGIDAGVIRSDDAAMPATITVPNPGFDDTLPPDPVDNPEFIDVPNPLLGVPAPSASRTSVSANGQCVQIALEGANFNGDDLGMHDRNGQPITAFNASLAWTSQGNRITITSAQGHRIELGVDIRDGYRATDDFPGPVAPRQAVDAAGDPMFDEDGDPIWVVDSNGNPIMFFEEGGTAELPGIPMELRIEAFGGLRIQIGPNYNMNMDIQIPRINAETLGLVEFRDGEMIRLLHYTTQEGASRAIDQTDGAIQRISRVRSRLGAYQNRLEHTIRNLDNAALNTASARSRVQDVDMAREMTLLSKRNVMYQAGLAILGQANQRPQMILQLLQ